MLKISRLVTLFSFIFFSVAWPIKAYAVIPAGLGLLGGAGVRLGFGTLGQQLGGIAGAGGILFCIANWQDCKNVFPFDGKHPAPPTPPKPQPQTAPRDDEKLWLCGPTETCADFCRRHDGKFNYDAGWPACRYNWGPHWKYGFGLYGKPGDIKGCPQGYAFNDGITKDHCVLIGDPQLVNPPETPCYPTIVNGKAVYDQSSLHCKSGGNENPIPDTNNQCTTAVLPDGTGQVRCGSELVTVTPTLISYVGADGKGFDLPIAGWGSSGATLGGTIENDTRSPPIGGNPPDTKPTDPVSPPAPTPTAPIDAGAITGPIVGAITGAVASVRDFVNTAAQSITGAVTAVGAAVKGIPASIAAAQTAIVGAIKDAVSVGDVVISEPQIPEVKKPEKDRDPPLLDISFLTNILPPRACHELGVDIPMPFVSDPVHLPLPVCGLADEVRPYMSFLWYAMTAIGIADLIVRALPRND